MLRKIARKTLPAGSRRRIAAGRVKNLVLHGAWGPNYRYKIWVNKYEPLTISSLVDSQDVKLSIVVPAFNTPKKYIEQLIDSVISQTYPVWELLISDCPTNKAASYLIKKTFNRDNPIKFLRVKKNLGISENTNVA